MQYVLTAGRIAKRPCNLDSRYAVQVLTQTSQQVQPRTQTLQIRGTLVNSLKLSAIAPKRPVTEAQ